MSGARQEPRSGWDGRKIERGIYVRDSGTFSVQVHVAGKKKRSTFSTLEEARTWRDEQIASRPKPKPTRRTLDERGIGSVMDSCWGSPEDIRAAREESRRLISSSPRSTTVIDGREFVVVHLPPTAGGIA